MAVKPVVEGFVKNATERKWAKMERKWAKMERKRGRMERIFENFRSVVPIVCFPGEGRNLVQKWYKQTDGNIRCRAGRGTGKRGWKLACAGQDADVIGQASGRVGRGDLLNKKHGKNNVNKKNQKNCLQLLIDVV